jgi:diguanylate cyclase (GGDEF)-like protein
VKGTAIDFLEPQVRLDLDKRLAPSDPLVFLLRLNAILTADSMPKGLMDGVMAALREIPEIESAWIGLPDETGRVIPQAYFGQFSTEHQDVSLLANTVIGPKASGPSGRAWRSGKPAIVDDWRKDPCLAPWQPGTKHLAILSAASVPLRGRGGHHGLLTMYSNRKLFFSDVWNIDVLTQLAAVIGNALENRQKQAALQRAQRLYETLFNGADILLSAATEREILRRLCKTLVDSGLFVSAAIGRVAATGMHRHVVAAARQNPLVMKTARAWLRPNQEKRSLTLDAWVADRTLIANRYFDNPRYSRMFPMAHAVGFRSIAGLIIRRGGVRWAVMGVTAAEEDYFDTELIKLLEQMTGMVGRALDELDLKAALRAEREAQSRMARRDTLTGLPNRLAFEEYLAAAITQAAAGGAVLGVGIIDLDHFKQINDRWGHGGGDEVLRKIADRLRAAMKPGDFIARLGGDEFALVAHPCGNQSDVSGFCKRLGEVVTSPICLPSGDQVQVTFSLGFAEFPTDHEIPDQLVRFADIALYEAKSARGDGSCFWRLYDGQRRDGARERLGRALLEAGRLRLHYQPVIDLNEGNVVAFEVLARLADGDNLLPPSKFLPGMTLDDRKLLFRLVLTGALAQLGQVPDMPSPIGISVNLDAHVLLCEETLPFIEETLAQAGITPNLLTLEVLETYDIPDMKRCAALLTAARALGIRIAMDDLGSGYSSMLNIRELPWDIVKLDRAFVAAVRQRPDDIMFVALVQSLTSALGIDLIVEGVEDEAVLDALRVMGVRLIQGYVIARPMEAAAMLDWIRCYHRPPASPEPVTLLGVYACQLNWLRVFNFLSLHDPTLAYLRQPNRFDLDGFFATHSLSSGAPRAAYDALHDLLARDGTPLGAIKAAADELRQHLFAALIDAG